MLGYLGDDLLPHLWRQIRAQPQELVVAVVPGRTVR